MPSPPDGPGTAPDVDEVASLAGQLRRLSHGVIDEEVERLARKASSLSETDMQQIAYTLHQVVEGMLVGRAAALPHHAAPPRGPHPRLFGLSHPCAGRHSGLRLLGCRRRGQAL